MKQVEIKKGRVVETPWMRIEDAAAYCGLSRSAFETRAIHVPHAGDTRLRLYHVHVLDRWIQGQIEDAPFVSSIEPEPGRRTRRHNRQEITGGEDPYYYVNPITGRARRGRTQQETEGKHHGEGNSSTLSGK